MAPPASPSVAGRQRRAWASLLPVALLLASLLLCAASSASAADSSAYEIVSTYALNCSVSLLSVSSGVTR
jgi:hypothetical protein